MDLPAEGALRQEGLMEFYGSFKEMFEFFCKNTTIHGTTRLVCSGSTRGQRALWALLLLASLGMLYWQFALMFSQFWSYPVVLTMSMHSEPKMFPAVTVCNRDPYRFEQVREHLEQLDRMAEEALRFLYGSSFSLGNNRNNGNGNNGNGNNGNGNNGNNGNNGSNGNNGNNGNRSSSSGFRLSHDFSLVRMTQIRAGRKRSSVGFQLCNSTGGSCFLQSFSSGLEAVLEWYRFHHVNVLAQLPPGQSGAEPGQGLRDTVQSCQYDGEPCRPGDFVHFHHPIFGSCYTFNSQGTDPFWTATKPGIPYGLSLLLRARQRGQLPLLSPVAGVRVLIHRHNQSPFLEHEGFDIRPGIATAIGIRQDEVNRLGGNYGRCTRDGADVAVELLYNSSYTLQACLHSCFQQLMLQQCGCGYYYYPLPAGARPCDYSRHPGWGHCFYQLYSQLRNHHLSCFEQCPKPCRESLYKVSAGSAKWPSAKSQDWVLQALRHQNGFNSSSSRDIAKVTIFYQQLNSQAVHEAPLLSENLLLSSMGSQWSLWFGSSVLSVVEMLELLLDALVLSLLCCLRRLRAGDAQNSRNSRNPAAPGTPEILQPQNSQNPAAPGIRESCSPGNSRNPAAPGIPKIPEIPKILQPRELPKSCSPGDPGILQPRELPKSCSPGNSQNPAAPGNPKIPKILQPRELREFCSPGNSQNPAVPGIREFCSPGNSQNPAAPGIPKILQPREFPKSCSPGNSQNSRNPAAPGTPEILQPREFPKSCSPGNSQNSRNPAAPGIPKILQPREFPKSCSPGNSQNPAAPGTPKILQPQNSQNPAAPKFPKSCSPGNSGNSAAPGIPGILQPREFQEFCSPGNPGILQPRGSGGGFGAGARN